MNTILKKQQLAEEVRRAKEEGVEFHLLQNTIRILGDDYGRVAGLECQRCELGEPDESGRAICLFPCIYPCTN